MSPCTHQNVQAYVGCSGGNCFMALKCWFVTIYVLQSTDLVIYCLIYIVLFIILNFLVKLVFMPEGAVKSTSYPMNKPMLDLKNAVSSQCGQPASSIHFLYDGKQVFIF